MGKNIQHCEAPCVLVLRAQTLTTCMCKTKTQRSEEDTAENNKLPKCCLHTKPSAAKECASFVFNAIVNAKEMDF